MQAADFVCLAFASDVSRDIEEGKIGKRLCLSDFSVTLNL